MEVIWEKVTVQQHCKADWVRKIKDESATQEKKSGTTSNSSSAKMQQKQFDKSHDLPAKTDSLLETLMSAKEQYDNVPNGLLQKKRKKKRRNHNL